MSKNKRNDSGIDGQFAPHLIEMFKSPAFRALSRAGLLVLHRLAIEWGDHGGNSDELTITFDQLVEYGLSRHSIAPALREMAALGFFVVTQKGRAGNADFRQPTKVRVTWLPAAGVKPAHDWRQITEDDAKMIAQGARRPGSNSANAAPRKNRNPVLESAPRIGAESAPKFSAESAPISVQKVHRNLGAQNRLLSRSSPSTALRAEPAVSPEPRAKPTPKPKPKAEPAAVNGNVNGAMPAVKPDPVSIARADALLDQKVAERDLLHGKRNPSVADDARLRQLLSEIAVLAGQIKTAKMMA